MPPPEFPWLELCVATGIGLLVGLERERRKADGPRRIQAGIRTFTAAALLGAAAQLAGGTPLVIGAALLVGALAVAAWLRSAAEDGGLTTAVALLLVLVLGSLALAQPLVAAALGTGLAVLLASRTRLHRFVQRGLDDQEVADFLTLAAATLIVLPMMPAGPLAADGPWAAFSPRTAWIVVILTMLIGALGHVARRLFGASRGLALAGFVSGFVSSAATIGAMGHRERREPALRRAAVAGAVLSTVATMVQMAVVLAATSLATLRAMALPLAAAGAVAAAYAWMFAGRAWPGPGPASALARTAAAAASAAPAEAPATPGRAFSLRQALGLAALLSLALVLSAALHAWLGDRGVRIAAALAGFADTHSAAVSVAALVAAERLPVQLAPEAILCALSTNTVTKMAAAAVGGRAYALQVVPGLALVLAAAWAAHLLAGG